MPNTDTHTETSDVIYCVSDLKAVFKKMKKDGVTSMKTEPILERKSCLEGCPGMEKAIAATTALELLNRLSGLGGKFNDYSFIKFSGRLSEFPTSVGQPSKPLPTYFREGAYHIVSEHEATKTEAGSEALIAGRRSLEF